jgi:lysozyme family protein
MGQVSSTRSLAGKGTALGAAISLILSATFGLEGGYVNNRSDPGGATNHGVTQAVARANGYTGDMRKLTVPQASEIAKKQYIDKPGFGPIIERSPAVGQEMFDTGYNAGPERVARWFQESLNHLNNRGRDYPDIAEDGKLGPGTYAAFDALLRRRGDTGCRVMVKMLDAKQAQHYMRLFGKNSQFETFAFGWFNDRIGNVDLAQCGRI